MYERRGRRPLQVGQRLASLNLFWFYRKTPCKIVNFVSLFPAPGPEIANSKYTGPLTGTPAALSTAINSPANWAHHATNDLGIIPERAS